MNNQEENLKKKKRQQQHLGCCSNKRVNKSRKVLEQEPAVLPCHPCASPLSPQLSCNRTPYLGPSVRVCNPYHVLSQYHFVSSPANHHAESTMDEKPDFFGDRCSCSILTPNGKRRARALDMIFNSQGLRFDEVYACSLERAKHTALFGCQAMDMLEEKIQCSDGLIEKSQGQWEGCHVLDIYTSKIVNIINRSQPDFYAPGGGFKQEVEFQMIEFLNNKELPNTDDHCTVPE